ncbi:MAG TPA: 3-keto-5-aminohexanoate cleavage protein [Alphaproteobacteria bacterium]|nr:3-keto-5-aminohexanoate cleavage protein [Alphaproteobacteria bacterium]
MAQKVIISCALTGSGDTVDKNPAVPVTPEQIARSALDARSAGAAIVHIHVRDPSTGKASRDPALYREVVARIGDAGSDVIVNLTTGAGARFVPGDNDPRTPAAGTTLTTPNERVAHVEELRPEICSLDMGSMNFGQHVFVNTPQHLQVMARAAKAAGVKPELEVFEAGHIRLARHMIEQGDIAAPALFQICLGIPWGAPADPASMTYMRDQLPPGSRWAAFGISSQQFPMVAQAVLLGGHVRVGLEDNLYLERGVLAPSNAALVEKAAKIVTLLGASVANPAEARDILDLPRR